MRSAKENSFPYNRQIDCYFEVYKDGRTKQIPHTRKCDRGELWSAYDRAKSGETTIYAVWVGNWESDLFIIDDLEAFKAAFK